MIEVSRSNLAKACCCMPRQMVSAICRGFLLPLQGNNEYIIVILTSGQVDLL
jgi:hypothetical protein